jgi:hypothetical protein
MLASLYTKIISFVSLVDGGRDSARLWLAKGRRRSWLLAGLLALPAALAIAYTVSYAVHLLGVVSVEHYFRGINCDDSYYYNKIALNFANGLFSTFDGINRTNGYHPLWMLFLIPVYWFESDLLSALTVIKVLEFAIIGASFIALVACSLPARFNLLFLLPIPPLFLANRSFYHGMEAGVLVLSLCLLWLALALKMRYRTSKAATALLATVLFLIPWTRLEAVSVSLFVPFMLLVGVRLKRVDLPFRSVLTVFSVAVASFAVYLLYNYLVFDVAVPISGMTKSQIFCTRVLERSGGHQVEKNFFLILKMKPYQQGLIYSGVALLMVSLKWVLSSVKRAHFRIEAIDLLVSGLAMGHVSLFAHTVVALCPLYSSYPRYFVVANLLAYLFVPYVAHTAYTSLVKIPVFRHAVWRGLLLLGIVGALLYHTDFRAPFTVAEGLAKKVNRNWGVADYYGAQILSAAVGPNDVVGSTDSGILGYFMEGRLINLDGLVNSKEFYNSAKNDLLGSWIEKNHITHFANVMRSRERNAKWFFGQLPHSRKGFRGTAQVVYEGISCYGRQRLFRIWRYSPKAETVLSADQNKVLFFKKMFEGAQHRQRGADTIYLKKNVLGLETSGCPPQGAGLLKTTVRVFPKDVGDINVRYRKRGYEEPRAEPQFALGGRCYQIVPTASYKKRKIVVSQKARPAKEGWRVVFNSP